ncbi:MAG: helix-turn-helix domain-containing protein [bacterium]|nr:helix-turn-helix domain-containing protein [bacterium]
MSARWTADEEATLLRMSEQGYTQTAIGKALGRDHSTISSKVRRMMNAGPDPRPPVELEISDTSTEIVGIIGDTHLPFELHGYLDFVGDTFVRHGVTRVVHIGDFVDNHAISYHEHDPDGMSPGNEYELALEKAKEWYQAFPCVTWLQGNHDRLPYRKLMSAGLPRRMMRDRLLETPRSWEAVDSVVIDDVMYTHGVGAGGGKHGARRMAAERGQSCVIGHFHQSAGIGIVATRDNAQRFGLTVGCGIDRHTYAFEYCKEQGSMALGCGIVRHGRVAHYEPMPPRRG